MAIPQMTEVPTYVVYRDIPAGEPFDPTSPLVFFPPQGSDELFDALRIAFPHVKSHSERMREAVISFLLEERQDDQSQQPSPAMTMDTMPTTWASMSSGSASLLSSPEILNFATPASFTNSPQPAQLTRQASTATSSQPSPPSLDAMTGVFSLSTSAQPKQRVRRKMTEAEKIEYRKRRIVKACDKCAKRKRKCPHNQAEMETVPSNKSGAKVTKSVSKSSKSATPPVAQQQALIDSSFSVDEFNFDPATFGPWEDFNMFEDPMAEVNMEEFVNFDQQQYGSDLFTPDVSPLQPYHDDSALLFPSLPATGSFDVATTVDRPTSEDRIHNGGRSGNGGSTGGSESPDLLNSSYASSDEWSSAGGYARQGNLLKNQQFLQNGDDLHGDGMLWEHLRTGQPEQPVPTHTAHVHNAQCGGSCGLDNIGGPQQTRRPPTLPQTILRLTGTAKALRAFANRPSRTPQLDAVSLEQASLAVSASRNSSLDQTDSATNRRSRPLSGIFDGAAYLENNLREAAVAHTPGRFEENHALDERQETHAQIHGPDVAANPRANFNTKQSRILESRALFGGIGRGGVDRGAVEPTTLTSTSVSVSDRSQRSERTQGRPEQVDSPAGRRAASLTSNTQQRSAVLSLGEGLASSADSSSELYMARKRISSNLHRLVERNANTAMASASSSRESGSKFKNGPSSSANGGAYLRLQESEASPSMTTALKPIRTHTRDPTMYNFNGAMDQHHNSETPTVAQAQAGPATTSKKSAAVDNASVASPEHEERLSDHFRYRDHHGRIQEHSCPDFANDHHDVRNTGANDHGVVDHAHDVATIHRLRNPSPSHAGEGESSWSKAAYCIAILASIFLAVAVLSTAPLSPTVLALALVYPLQTSDEKESPVHCTTKNSRWLKNLLPNKGFSTHKLAKAKDAETANGVWLRGLMYPHEMAPLQTARA